MKRFFLVFIFGVYSGVGFAGHESGDGGGTIVRLMSYAHKLIAETLPTLKPEKVHFHDKFVVDWYKEKFDLMAQEIRDMKLVMVEDNLFDSRHGYETWVRLNSDKGFVVEYNADTTKYKNFVGVLQPRLIAYKLDEREPALADVTEYLLHEIGHRYGLDEYNAWVFAQSLVAYFKFTLRMQPMTCRLSMPISRFDAVSEVVVFDPEKNIEYRKTIGGLEYRMYLHTQVNMLSIDINDKKRNLERIHSLRIPAVGRIVTEVVVDDEGMRTKIDCE